jgi:aerobic carbon-monoxide dehydrogenase medium subunit
MKPARFDYVRPATLPDALDVLARHGGDAAVLAGGQSLMPMMNLRLATPAVLVDIGRIPELDRVSPTVDRLTIAARATHAGVLRSREVRRHVPLLAQALPYVAHQAIRNRGTLGGSLALADPAAELPACMVCLGAEIHLQSVRGGRSVAAEDFFRGVYTTDRATDELLVSVSLPLRPEGWHFRFLEVARRHGDFALAGLAFAARFDGARLVECRLAYCGVEGAPRRLRVVEACLTSGEMSARADAREALAGTLSPEGSREYPSDYRRKLAAVLLDRAVDGCRQEGMHVRD